MSKNELLKVIIRELRRAQREPWVPPPAGRVKGLRLPPALPLEDGRQLYGTDELLKAVADYSAVYVASSPELRLRFKDREVEQLSRRAFGTVLTEIDLEEGDEVLCPIIRDNVDRKIAGLTERTQEALQFTAGCHLFESSDAYPIRVGPVSFETRDQWIQRALEDGKISTTTARRLRAAWSSRRLAKRKASLEAHAEESILEAVGPCDIICSVTTDGLSSQMVKDKSLLASRLAMTAIAMMWGHPSQGLEWRNLLYDRRLPRRHYVLFAKSRWAGSSSSMSQMPSGRWTDAELLTELRSYQDLFDQFGEALFAYVQPVRPVTRPAMMNALFLSLWWHHEACRESSDQIATTKFVAGLDALVPGQDAHAIMRFIQSRLGLKPTDALMKDGRTTKAVIIEIYNARRSRLIHGSSSNFAQDWSSVRSTAEAVGRLCMVSAADWLASNGGSDDLEQMSLN